MAKTEMERALEADGEKLLALTGQDHGPWTEVAPPCGVCGKDEHVAIYPQDRGHVVCMECCDKTHHPDGEDGHQFDYHHGQGWACRYCGVDRNTNNYDYAEDDL